MRHLEVFLLLVAAGVPLAVAARVLYASRNTTRDPTTPGWRVVSRQLGREIRTEAMPKPHALDLAQRLMLGAVKVVRLDNDADGKTMTLAEIRADMEKRAHDG